ncbi:MAG TPA: HDOD domain-containing protein [Gallionella sp.]|nr:HDOD domain-containing protein [Gallionella sp.]
MHWAYLHYPDPRLECPLNQGPFMILPPTLSVEEQLLKAINNDELILPTLPDVALKIQQMMDNMDIPASRIVTLVSGDPVIAAQLIKAANSAIYAEKPRIDNVSGAISRLGYRTLRNLVLNITMSRLAKADQPAIKMLLANFWEHSREVAAISHMLAKNQRHLNADQAMLAGLIHDIGTLPLCIYVDKMRSNFDGPLIEGLILQFRGYVGEKLLRTWGFPDEIVEVIPEHENLQRNSESHQASYADIVTVANLMNRLTAKVVPWEDITALQRLHISPDICRNFHERFGDELSTTHEMLFPH